MGDGVFLRLFCSRLGQFAIGLEQLGAVAAASAASGRAFTPVADAARLGRIQSGFLGAPLLGRQPGGQFALLGRHQGFDFLSGLDFLGGFHRLGLRTLGHGAFGHRHCLVGDGVFLRLFCSRLGPFAIGLEQLGAVAAASAAPRRAFTPAAASTASCRIGPCDGRIHGDVFGYGRLVQPPPANAQHHGMQQQGPQPVAPGMGGRSGSGRMNGEGRHIRGAGLQD